MNREECIGFIKETKIITICRKVYGEELFRLATVLAENGIQAIEVTYDQVDPDCVTRSGEAIAMLRSEFGDRMIIGAGTVLTLEQLEGAHKAGAQFIIAPNFNPSIVSGTKERGMVSIPGTMTPTEILAAYYGGADFVKLFPSGWLGFDYIKDILAPITHVPLIATGGVSEENAGRYFDAGFAGIAVSSRLCGRALLDEGNYAEIGRRATEFVRISGR